MTDLRTPGTEDAPALDEPVRRLFEHIAGPAAAATPDLPSIGAALVGLAGDLDYVGRWVEALGDESGSRPIHAPARGPRLMIVHRRQGEMGAVHDHSTWVAIAPIVGLETHRRWRVVGGDGQPRLELLESRGLHPADVATLLPPDDLHDHGHLAGNGHPAYVLILTGDNQSLFTRNEWDIATGRRRVLEPGDRGRWLATQPWPAG
jgi:hypothetical protein